MKASSCFVSLLLLLGCFCTRAGAFEYKLKNYSGKMIQGVSRVEGIPVRNVNALYLDSANDILYCGVGPSIYSIDVHRPLEPKVLGSVTMYGMIRQMTVQGNVLYAACREAGVYLINVSDPRQLSIISRYDPVELSTGIDVAGDVLFLGTRMNGVEFVDVSDPVNPTHIRIEKTKESQSVAYRDGILYSGEWSGHCVTVMDASDMSRLRTITTVELKGFGDGVWVNGNYLYASTGHNLTAPGLPESERKGKGHGMEIFDISEPAEPRFVSRVSFDDLYWRSNDYWMVRTFGSGNYAVCADAANGIYLVDARKKTRPKIVSRINFNRNDGRQVAVTSVAVGKGVIYASVYNDCGLVMLECPAATTDVQEHGTAPERADFRFPYVTPKGSHFKAWKPGVYSPVRGVADYGDLVFAACSYGGLGILRMNSDGNLVQIGNGPMAYAGDVKVRDGKLYVAEGFEGLGIYEIGEGGTLSELSRFNEFSHRGTKPACLWVFVPDDSHIIASTRHNGYYFLDASDINNISIIKTEVGREVPGWDKYVADAPDSQGWFPRMSHHASVNWINLNDPDLKETADKTLVPELFDGVCSYSNDRFITVSHRYFYIYSAGEIGAPKNGQKGEFRGMPMWDGGSRVSLTYRSGKQISMVDLSDEGSPKLLWMEPTTGYPETPVFWDGRLLVPCGYQGLLIEKKK